MKANPTSVNDRAYISTKSMSIDHITEEKYADLKLKIAAMAAQYDKVVGYQEILSPNPIIAFNYEDIDVKLNYDHDTESVEIHCAKPRNCEKKLLAGLVKLITEFQTGK